MIKYIECFYVSGGNMVNSHFVPQLILRHFCEDEKINYVDLKTNKAELRTTKSIFSEKGYYPEELEKNLCEKIEVQFANVLNKKIVNERHNIILTSYDQLVLKKFLIISALRVRDDDMQQNAWYRALKRDGFITDEIDYKELSGDFFENINKVLGCETPDALFDLVESADANLNLISYIRDIVYSYNVFVKTNNCKEDFIITDRGWAGYCGPISVKKLNAMHDLFMMNGDPLLLRIVQMSSPLDYAVFPLSRNMALIAMSSAFKIFDKSMPYNFIYPENAPTLSQCLGFGNSEIISLPGNRYNRSGEKEYTYEIKQLTRKDVKFLNTLLLKNANQHFAYANYERVKYSIEE